MFFFSLSLIWKMHRYVWTGLPLVPLPLFYRIQNPVMHRKMQNKIKMIYFRSVPKKKGGRGFKRYPVLMYLWENDVVNWLQAEKIESVEFVVERIKMSFFRKWLFLGWHDRVKTSARALVSTRCDTQTEHL